MATASYSKHAVPFPEHMLLIGRTASGKSSLVGDMFSNIDQVYRRHTRDSIVIVLSPFADRCTKGWKAQPARMMRGNYF